MARAAILLSALALLAVLANVVVGAGIALGLVGIRSHFTFAVPTSIFALGAWTVVVFYFVGAFAWVEAEVAEGSLDRELVAEARRIRQGMLPWIAATVLALIAAYVLGGASDTRAVPRGVHLVLALLALGLHVVTAYRTIIFAGMALDLQARVERGGA